MGATKLILEGEIKNLESPDQLPWLKELLLLLRDLRYGSVTLIVQDGRLVQMERNEKIRFC